MDLNALRQAMFNPNVPLGYLPGFISGMLAANCTTPNRAAMWCAQIGHESVGLKYMEEIANGEAYNGRADLGNTQPGDGPRFKGRGPIQLTGRVNYGNFGRWCAARGYIGDPNYFINNPAMVANPAWGFIAAAWYWVVARSDINALCDQQDIVGVTQRINGGQNGIDDRRRRYNYCLSVANQLVPVAAPTRKKVLDLMIDRQIVRGNNSGSIVLPTGSASAILNRAWFNVRCDGGGMANVWFQRSADSNDPPPGVAQGANWINRPFKHAAICGGQVPDGTQFIQYSIDANGNGNITVELEPK